MKIEVDILPWPIPVETRVSLRPLKVRKIITGRVTLKLTPAWSDLVDGSSSNQSMSVGCDGEMKVRLSCNGVASAVALRVASQGPRSTAITNPEFCRTIEGLSIRKLLRIEEMKQRFSGHIDAARLSQSSRCIGLDCVANEIRHRAIRFRVIRDVLAWYMRASSGPP